MDTILRSRTGDSLSLEEMQRRLPAIFAGQPHESRSDRYVYIPTRDVLAKLMEEGFDPVEARVTLTRDESKRSHAKHMVRLRQRQTKAPTARKIGDTHFEVVLRNAHDGSAAYDFMAGLFRLVCLNGMVVADGYAKSAHVRHSGNRDRQLGEVIDAAYSVVSEAPKVIEAAQRWSEIELKRDEQVAFAESARVIRFGDSDGHVDTPIEASQLLVPRRSADSGSDLWSVFNRVQENAIRGGLSAYNRETHRRTSSREVKGIDSDIKLNKALWQLGAKMAELKAA